MLLSLHMFALHDSAMMIRLSIFGTGNNASHQLVLLSRALCCQIALKLLDTAREGDTPIYSIRLGEKSDADFVLARATEALYDCQHNCSPKYCPQKVRTTNTHIKF